MVTPLQFHQGNCFLNGKIIIHFKILLFAAAAVAAAAGLLLLHQTESAEINYMFSSDLMQYIFYRNLCAISSFYHMLAAEHNKPRLNSGAQKLNLLN